MCVLMVVFLYVVFLFCMSLSCRVCVRVPARLLCVLGVYVCLCMYQVWG